MTQKIWHKKLHQRKIWKTMTPFSKTCYYLQPFAEHIIDVWAQPLPFPTILKVLQSFVLILVAMIPLIYPSLILLYSYAELQHLVQSQFHLQFPEKLDLIKYGKEVYQWEVSKDEPHSKFLALYVERWRLIGTAITSSIDYFRMACYLLLGFEN